MLSLCKLYRLRYLPLFLVIVLLATPAAGQEGPIWDYGVAINPATRECADFTYVHNGKAFPPRGWEVSMLPFVPLTLYTSHAERMAQTRFGTCRVQGFAKDCCLQLGLRYLPHNVAIEPDRNTGLYPLLAAVAASLLTVFVARRYLHSSRPSGS